ncbi:hypothetical protein, partial [Enterococcus faecium]|uniref:hypothetical protein n=1 Tax=Enterococcus faecium TaxID=1352 RepID=UPI003DA06916
MPVKDLICPYLYDNCGMGNEPLGTCVTGCGFGGRISDCKCFKDTANCWKLYDTGNVTKHYKLHSKIYDDYL